MAPTVKEMLLKSGMSEAAIAALDQNVIAGLTTVVSTAAQLEESARAEREAAELAHRAQKQLYDEKVAPALNQWGNEKVTLEAEREYYRKAFEGAKAAGFIAKDAPGFTPAANGNANTDPNRGNDGRYVPNAGGVPGSPAYMTGAQTIGVVGLATWAINEHMRLFGAPLPDDLETLDSEATAQRMPFKEYVSKKYKFEDKKKEIAEQRDKVRIDAIVAEEVKKRDQYWAERNGSNPNVATGTPSQYTQLKAGVDSKQIKDPLMMSKQERHAQTSQLINRDIAENAAAVH